MQREEKLQHQQQIEAYLQNKNVYGLFESILSQLSLHQPEDSLQFIIDHLSKKPCKRLFIIGHDIDDFCKKLASQIGYEHLNIPQKPLEVSNDDDAMDHFEKNFTLDKNFIIQNFPMSLNQAQALQQSKMIPDLILFIEHTDQELQDNLLNTYPDQKDKIQTYLALNKLNLNQVKKVYEEINYQVESKNADVEIQRILNYNIGLTLKSPLILFVPEEINGQELSYKLAKKYDLVHISVSSLINEQIQRNTPIGKQIQAKQNIHEIEKDLVLMRIKKKDCRMQGFVVQGFPKNQNQVTDLVKNQVTPNFIIDVYENEKTEFLKTVNQNYKNIVFHVENKGTQNMLEKVTTHIRNFKPEH